MDEDINDNENDDGDLVELSGLSPVELSELKLRILHGDSGEAINNDGLIHELIKLGTEATPLIPIVVDQYRTGKLTGVAPSSLIELYLRTKDVNLLAALQDKGTIQQCGIYDQCLLFESGVAHLEKTLLDFLWNNWDTPRTPQRVNVVQALGKCGGTSALEMLEVVRFRLAGGLSEQKAQLERPIDEEIEDISEASRQQLQTKANASLLDEVRLAVRNIKERTSNQ